MEVYLLSSNNSWIVTYSTPDGGGSSSFNTIELAASFMVDVLKVDDDEIDSALVEMYALKRKRSIFRDGKFTETQEDFAC